MLVRKEMSFVCLSVQAGYLPQILDIVHKFIPLFSNSEVISSLQDGLEEEEDKTFDNLMDIASDSSKEEEIRAICKSRGVHENGLLPAVLKALDEEYHFLLDQSQSNKADYVQKLYEWKSAQAKGNTNLGETTAGNSFLTKALLKFLDAVACDPNSSRYHMHVGRLLLMQSKYEDAIKRLEAAFGLKPTSIEARYIYNFIDPFYRIPC